MTAGQGWYRAESAIEELCSIVWHSGIGLNPPRPIEMSNNMISDFNKNKQTNKKRKKKTQLLMSFILLEPFNWAFAVCSWMCVHECTSLDQQNVWVFWIDTPCIVTAQQTQQWGCQPQMKFIPCLHKTQLSSSFSCCSHSVQPPTPALSNLSLWPHVSLHALSLFTYLCKCAI